MVCWQCRIVASCLALVAGSNRICAEEPALRAKLSGEDRTLARRLTAIDQRVRAGQWSEVLDACIQLMDESGDDLVALAEDGRHCQRVRDACQLRMSALPSEALRLYRQRVDAQARRLLDAGRAQGDDPPLYQLVDQWFCSRPAEAALDLLGDRAFERGEFEAAEHWWSRLALPASQSKEPLGLGGSARYPDPQGDLARVRAKQIVARIFRGELHNLESELEAFRELHPEARGRLLGKSGTYASLLEELAENAALARVEEPDQDWTTFAARSSRSNVLKRAPGRLGELRPLESPQWRIALSGAGKRTETHGADADKPEPLPAPGTARLLAFHPVFLGNHVLIAGERQVTAYDLDDGMPVTFRLDGVKAALPVKWPPEPDQTFTLTVAGNRVFARLGTAALGPTRSPEPQTFLVCLELQVSEAGKQAQWQLKWQKPIPAPGMLEGAPLVIHKLVFAAVSQFDETGQSRTSIQCHDAETGAMVWRQELCVAAELRVGDRRFRHHLVSAAGPNLVYCTHTGVIAALDCRSGRRVWAVRYPSRGGRLPDNEPSPRGLAPCLCVGGRIYAAPLDLDRIICLDAATGRTCWETSALEVVQMLGVAKGRLICTYRTPRPVTAGVPRAGILAFDVDTGLALRNWMQPSEGDLPSHGHGFLAGDWVYWPTINGLRVLTQEDGQPVRAQDWKCPPGNLAACAGYLVVAGTEELLVYPPGARLLPRRRAEAARVGATALAQYRLALSEFDAGLTKEAVATFVSALRRARAEDPKGALARHIQEQCHEALLDLANTARSSKAWEDAAAWLTRAASDEFPRAARLIATERLASLWEEASDPAKVAAVWQSVLGNPSLHSGVLPKESGDTPKQRAADALARLAAPRAGDRVAPLEHERGTPRHNKANGAPDQLPAVSLPLRIGWQINLGRTGSNLSDRWLTASSGKPPSVVFIARGRQLSCSSMADGQLRWMVPLSHSPSWAACSDQGVVAGSAGGIAGINLEDGRRLWGWDAGTEELAGFTLEAEQLYFCRGSRELYALDAWKGTVLWRVMAPGALIRPVSPGGSYLPHFGVGDRQLVVHTSGGFTLILDATTGRLIAKSSYTPHPWPQSPVQLGRDRMCLATSPSQVVAVRQDSGEVVWRHDLNWPSLTGEIPRLIGNEQVLLVLIARSYGWELERLDPETGKSLWRHPRPHSIAPIHVESIAFDDRAVYYISRASLDSVALSDGSHLWRLPLRGSNGPWRTVRGTNELFVHPLNPQGARMEESAAVALLSPANPIARMCLTLQARLATHDRIKKCQSVVHVVDPKTGNLLQTCDFEAEGTQFAVQRTVTGVCVFLGNRVWGLVSSRR